MQSETQSGTLEDGISDGDLVQELQEGQWANCSRIKWTSTKLVTMLCSLG